MDFGSTTKASAVGVFTAAARTDAIATRGSIPVELPREQTVREVVERRIVIDPRTRAVVFQKTDKSTGETVTQLPTEAMLKLRLYSRELTERARQADAEGNTAHYVERTA
jgi:hypothetical protein